MARTTSCKPPSYAPSSETLFMLLKAGAIVAYPTEGVWGLGCVPLLLPALVRLRQLKARDADKGFILLASDWSMVSPFIAKADAMYTRWLQNGQGFTTCVFTASDQCPSLLCAADGSIAVRITAHPIVTMLCETLGAALVSTSANLVGASPASNENEIREIFSDRIDAIVEGELGGANKASRLLDLRQNPPKILRE